MSLRVQHGWSFKRHKHGATGDEEQGTSGQMRSVTMEAMLGSLQFTLWIMGEADSLLHKTEQAHRGQKAGWEATEGVCHNLGCTGWMNEHTDTWRWLQQPLLVFLLTRESEVAFISFSTSMPSPTPAFRNGFSLLHACVSLPQILGSQSCSLRALCCAGYAYTIHSVRRVPKPIKSESLGFPGREQK